MLYISRLFVFEMLSLFFLNILYCFSFYEATFQVDSSSDKFCKISYAGVFICLFVCLFGLFPGKLLLIWLNQNRRENEINYMMPWVHMNVDSTSSFSRARRQRLPLDPSSLPCFNTQSTSQTNTLHMVPSEVVSFNPLLVPAARRAILVQIKGYLTPSVQCSLKYAHKKEAQGKKIKKEQQKSI